MLGTSITSRLEANQMVTSCSSNELDLNCSRSVDAIIARKRPDYVINCAAYTAVDLAEQETTKAYQLNATAVQHLAQVCNQYRATLIHFSTDYVFSGMEQSPYQPDHQTNPVNVYGASKLAGEKAISRLAGAFYIFRTSWLYAPYGKNFYKWVAGTDAIELKIVDTQRGAPTSCLDLADFINHLIKNDPRKYGTYHLTNKGEMTWYDFAVSINQKQSLDKKIIPVAKFDTAASRPNYSVMDLTLTEEVFQYSLPTVDEGLDGVVTQSNKTI